MNGFECWIRFVLRHHLIPFKQLYFPPTPISGYIIHADKLLTSKQKINSQLCMWLHFEVSVRIRKTSMLHYLTKHGVITATSLSECTRLALLKHLVIYSDIIMINCQAMWATYKAIPALARSQKKTLSKLKRLNWNSILQPEFPL